MATSSAANGEAGQLSTKVEGKKLQVITGPQLPAALGRAAVSVEGVCPADAPTWPFPTTTTYDRRHMQPLTVRFSAQDEAHFAGYLQQQDAIRQEIWRSIDKIANKHGEASNSLPVIVFQYDPLDAANRHGAIELTFESPSLFSRVRDGLNCLTIEEIGHPPHSTLSVRRWSNSLYPNVMPFDILGLPLTSTNSKAIFDSVKSMMASLGNVLGLAKLEITTTTDGKAHPRTDTARFYLQLTPTSMKMSWPSLIAAIPTHFVWESIPRTLQYSGRQLHQVAKHSDDYPVQEETNNATDSASSATPQTSSSAASSSGSSSSVKVEGSNDSNKRKRK